MLKELLAGPPQRTLAVAESMTGGRIQSIVTAESGASAFFRGGITAYTIDQKVRHLSVDRAGAAAVDCVSAEVALQMARGACALFGADIGVATTGYAEPLAGPSQGVYWAVCDRRTGQSGEVCHGGYLPLGGMDRTAAQQIAAVAVVESLRSILLATHSPYLQVEK
jgi:nicotinamide-nucleotide amidase